MKSRNTSFKSIDCTHALETGFVSRSTSTILTSCVKTQIVPLSAMHCMDQPKLAPRPMKLHLYGGLREGTDSIRFETLLFYITYFDLCLIRVLPHDATFERLADTELCRLSLGMMYWIGDIHGGRYSATICIYSRQANNGSSVLLAFFNTSSVAILKSIACRSRIHRMRWQFQTAIGDDMPARPCRRIPHNLCYTFSWP
jgi:hypothetical protein